MADVADKGVGAALYMALARTLIRTYAAEINGSADPAYVLATANRRIMQDTTSNQFVTVFMGVINPSSGTLTYANAGHNPPYLFRAANGDSPESLTLTGMPVGIYEDTTWDQREVAIRAGDVIALYSDGVSEAENHSGEPFGDDRLIAAVGRARRESAESIQRAAFDAVRAFTGDVPPFDDATLMVVRRVE